eukprot:403362858
MYGQTFQLTFKGEKELGFDIAFTTSFPLTKDFGEFQMFQDTQVRKLNITTGMMGKNIQLLNYEIDPTITSKQLELVVCGIDNFNYENKDEIKFKQLDTYTCMKDKSQLTIGGTFQSVLFTRLRIFLVPCQNSTASSIVCKSDEQQRIFYNNLDLRIRYVQRYYNSEDFIKPINAYIEDKIVLPLQYGVKKGLELHLKKNKVVLNDNILPFQSSQEETFISPDTYIFFQADVNRRGFSFAHIDLRLDRRQDVYTRNVYSISQLLSDVGGIYNTLFLIGFILASQFSEKIFYAKAIKEIFQTYDMKEKKTQDKHDFKESQVPKNLSINIGKLSKSVTATSFNITKQESGRDIMNNSQTQTPKKQTMKISQHLKPNVTIQSIQDPIKNVSRTQTKMRNSTDYNIEDSNQKLKEVQEFQQIPQLNQITQANNFSRKSKILIEDLKNNNNKKVKVSPGVDQITEVNFQHPKFDKEEWEVNYKAVDTTKDLLNKNIGLSKFSKRDASRIVNSAQEQYILELDKSNASIIEFNPISKMEKSSKDTISETDSYHTTLIQRLINEIMSRMNFKYTFKDIMMELFLKCKFKKDKQQLRKKKMFYKAIRKIDHEFDAVNLMKTMKQVRLMQKVIMNQTQNLLMGFQYKYVLDPNQNEIVQNDSDSEVDVVKTIKKMRSDNNLVRILTSGKMKKQLTQYLDKQGQKIENIDKRLLDGIFPISSKEKIKQQNNLNKQKPLTNDNYETKQPIHLMSKLSGSQISLQDRYAPMPDRFNSDLNRQIVKNETVNYYSVNDINNLSIQDNQQFKHEGIVDKMLKGESQSQLLSAEFNSVQNKAKDHELNKYNGVYSPSYIRSLDNSMIDNKFQKYY